MVDKLYTISINSVLQLRYNILTLQQKQYILKGISTLGLIVTGIGGFWALKGVTFGGIILTAIGGCLSFFVGDKIIENQKRESIEKEYKLRAEKDEAFKELSNAINNIPIQQRQQEIRKKLEELKKKSSPQRRAVTGLKST